MHSAGTWSSSSNPICLAENTHKVKEIWISRCKLQTALNQHSAAKLQFMFLIFLMCVCLDSLQSESCIHCSQILRVSNRSAIDRLQGIQIRENRIDPLKKWKHYQHSGRTFRSSQHGQTQFFLSGVWCFCPPPWRALAASGVRRRLLNWRRRQQEHVRSRWLYRQNHLLRKTLHISYMLNYVLQMRRNIYSSIQRRSLDLGELLTLLLLHLVWRFTIHKLQ